MAQPADPYLAERRREILEGAARVFVRHGFERATMQQIASEVGLSPGALYRYFPGKEALITTVCGAASADKMLPFDAPEPGKAAFDVLVDGGRAIWESIGRDEARDEARMWLEATVAGLRHPETVGAHLARELTGVREQLATLIAAAKAEGTLADDVDDVALAALLIGATNGMQMLSVQLEGDVDSEASWTLLLRILDGLRPREAE